MDPILEAATKKLYAKLRAARKDGKQFDTDVLEQWLRKETAGKYGVADAQNLVAEMGKGTAANFGRSLRHGALYGWDDEAIGAMDGDEAGASADLQQRSYKEQHPVLSGIGNAIGGLTAPLIAGFLAPEALGGAGVAATMGRTVAAGAAGGAVAGAGEAPAGDKLDGALYGAGAGALAGPVSAGAAKLAGAGARAIRNAAVPSERRVIEQAGRMMPQGLEQQAARQEMLAPGTFLPAGASEEAAQHVAAGVGAAPHANLAAIDRARQALAKVMRAREDIGADYDDLARRLGPIRTDNDLRDILHGVGEDQAGMGQTIGFQPLHELRTHYREKLGSATKAADRRRYGQFVDRLSNWLSDPKRAGAELRDIDSRYSFLSRTQENYEKLLQTVERTNMAHAKNALYGAETGSIGGTLTTGGSRGLAQRAVAALTPNKAARATAVAEQMVAPADASMVARLAASRQQAMRPPAPTPFTDVAVPAATGGAIAQLLETLRNPMPPQMGPQ